MNRPAAHALVAVVVALVVVAAVLYLSGPAPNDLDALGHATVDVAGQQFNVAVATTTQQHQAGLAHVPELPHNGVDGMLFQFDSDVTTPFWQAGVRIPLDIVWADNNGNVVGIDTMERCRWWFIPPSVSPCPDYHPSGPYRSALELPAGTFSAADRSQEHHLDVVSQRSGIMNVAKGGTDNDRTVWATPATAVARGSAHRP